MAGIAPIPNPLPASNPPFALNHARILYSSVLTSSVVTTSGGANGDLVLIPNTADRWTITAGASEAILFTLPANSNVDTVCIGAHNLGSSGATVSVIYDADAIGGGWVTFAPAVAPNDDTAIMFHVGTAVSARRIQINISSGFNDLFIGSVYAGVALQMQRPFFSGHTPLPLSASTVRYSSMTEGGNFVGEQIRRIGFNTSGSWSNLENDWYRFYFQPFVIHARTLPFYFAWNLAAYPTDVGYVKTSQDISPAYGVRDKFDVSFDMVGFG